jgi:hypothetical protein
MTSPATGTPHQPDTILPALVSAFVRVTVNDVASEMVIRCFPTHRAHAGGGAAILGVLDGAASRERRSWISGRLADCPPSGRHPGGYATAVFVPLSAIAMASQVGFRVLGRWRLRMAQR